MVKFTLKHKILNILIENKQTEYSIKELSELLKVDYKNTHTAVTQLKDSINIRKKSNSSFLSFKPLLTPDTFIVETERKKKITQELKLILKDIDSEEDSFIIIIVFGSYAKGTQTKHSDIDMCLVYNNEDELKNLQKKLQIHPKIELHPFHFAEFVRMLEQKKFNVAHEISNIGIPLQNIEGFYKLLKHEYQ
jgi:predicted nucleotidyltransferase